MDSEHESMLLLLENCRSLSRCSASNVSNDLGLHQQKQEGQIIEGYNTLLPLLVMRKKTRIICSQRRWRDDRACAGDIRPARSRAYTRRIHMRISPCIVVRRYMSDLVELFLMPRRYGSTWACISEPGMLRSMLKYVCLFSYKLRLLF